MKTWYETDRLVVLESRQACYACKQDTPVYALGAERFREVGADTGDRWTDVVFDFVDAVDEPAWSAIQQITGGRFRKATSKTISASYLMNHCACCNAKQGDFYMREIGGAFAPTTPEQAQALQRHDLKVPTRVRADWLTVVFPGPFQWLRGEVDPTAHLVIAQYVGVNEPGDTGDPTQDAEEEATMSNTKGPTGDEPRKPGLGALFSTFSDDNPPDPPAGIDVTPVERRRPNLRLVETAPAAEVEHLEDEGADPSDPKVRERRRREAWVKSLYGNLLLAEYLGDEGMTTIRSILEIENGARFVLADPRAGSVTDSGRSITASTTHADALALVAGLAKARGWTKVKISAADPDAEAQLAARLIEAGVEVVGYSEPASPKRSTGPRL